MEVKKNLSCHGDSGKSSMKHMLMMLVCCLLPVGLAVLLNALGYSAIAGYMMLLLCPLLHIAMMKLMSTQEAKEDESATISRKTSI